MTEGTVPLRSALAGGVLTLTLDRPEKRNALSAAMVEALHVALERADLDAEARVVVLRGAGKDFCAGADLDELLASVSQTVQENEAAALRLGSLFQRIRALPKPVLAVVQGRALAGGAGLAGACDLVIAGSSAQLGYPEIQRGFVPAMVMALLRRSVGEKIALDLVLTGRLLSAEEAHRLGLVSRILEDGQLEKGAMKLAAELAGSSPSALAFSKQLFYQLDDDTVAQGIARGAQVNAIARTTPDFRDAVARFLHR
jgi:methylglutaconyl-CoA hydratase